MGLSDFFARVADQQRPEGMLDSALQASLAAVAPVYATGAYLNRMAHDLGLVRREVLPATVFSVGNITLGGTGKTPFCLWLTDWLREQGRQPGILTRGYGREDERRLLIVHDGRRLRATTRQAGDEPILLARTLGDVPVVACADRIRGGRYALRKFKKLDTLVLDDGFQHHALARQADIVLVDSTVSLRSLRLFPRGSLREAPPTLSRAHLVVLTRWQQAEQPRSILREVRRFAPAVPVARAKLEITGAHRLANGEDIPLEELRGRSAYLAAGVANPRSVRQSALEIGMKLTGARRLPDHATYTRRSVVRLENTRRKRKAEFLVVTEKDAVKLEELGDLPESIVALRARVAPLEEKDARIMHRVLKARLEAGVVRGYLR